MAHFRTFRSELVVLAPAASALKRPPPNNGCCFETESKIPPGVAVGFGVIFAKMPVDDPVGKSGADGPVGGADVADGLLPKSMPEVGSIGEVEGSLFLKMSSSGVVVLPSFPPNMFGLVYVVVLGVIFPPKKFTAGDVTAGAGLA